MFSNMRAAVAKNQDLTIRWVFGLLVAGLVCLGLWMFAHSDSYLFWSSQNLRDVLEAKAAALFILLLAILTTHSVLEECAFVRL